MCVCVYVCFRVHAHAHACTQVHSCVSGVCIAQQHLGNNWKTWAQDSDGSGFVPIGLVFMSLALCSINY